MKPRSCRRSAHPSAITDAVVRAAPAEGTPVDLENDHGGERRVGRRFLVVPYDIPRRCLATYFPEANVLVPLGRVAEGSHTPASKDVLVCVRPSS